MVFFNIGTTISNNCLLVYIHVPVFIFHVHHKVASGSQSQLRVLNRNTDVFKYLSASTNGVVLSAHAQFAVEEPTIWQEDRASRVPIHISRSLFGRKRDRWDSAIGFGLNANGARGKARWDQFRCTIHRVSNPQTNHSIGNQMHGLRRPLTTLVNWEVCMCMSNLCINLLCCLHFKCMSDRPKPSPPLFACAGFDAGVCIYWCNMADIEVPYLLS